MRAVWVFRATNTFTLSCLLPFFFFFGGGVPWRDGDDASVSVCPFFSSSFFFLGPQVLLLPAWDVYLWYSGGGGGWLVDVSHSRGSHCFFFSYMRATLAPSLLPSLPPSLPSFFFFSLLPRCLGCMSPHRDAFMMMMTKEGDMSWLAAGDFPHFFHQLCLLKGLGKKLFDTSIPGNQYSKKNSGFQACLRKIFFTPRLNRTGTTETNKKKRRRRRRLVVSSSSLFPLFVLLILILFLCA